ncbi:MAG TPA: hypothetical protein VEI80_05700 [Candidatus Acidoferrales bacterium]|nr:hypothetical protein [Candidatus Acidoferrales bacterium]
MRGDRRALRLDALWSALPEGRWVSKEALKEAAGADDVTLARVINFLTCWDFIELRTTPELQFRRKEGTVDPLEAVERLRELNTNRQKPILASGRRRVAERFACRLCGSKNLKYVGENMTECHRCHERQWYAIDIAQTSFPSTLHSATKPSLGARILIRLGRSQPTIP